MLLPTPDPYHFLNPALVDLTPEAIQVVRYHSEIFKQNNNIVDDVLWFNVLGSDPIQEHLAETIKRIRSTIERPGQVVVFWAAEYHQPLSIDSVDALNKFGQSISNPVVYFTGSLGKHIYNNLKFTIVPIMSYEWESYKQWTRPEFAGVYNSVNRSRKFMMMGTKDYPERKFLLSRVIMSGQFEQGYVSYRQLDSGTLSTLYTKEERDNILSVGNLIDDRLPLPVLFDSDTGEEWTRMPRICLSDSYLNMVTDTYYMIPGGNTFLSEKVFNAMGNGQIFIMLSPPGTLAWLHGQGYQTFSNYIDESYDNIKNDHDRLQAVSTEFIKFIQRPIEQINSIYRECLPIVEHNKKRLFECCFKETIQNGIRRAIDEKS